MVSYLSSCSFADPTLESPEFQVLSLDGKVWVFEAGTPEEAETWVKSIEEQIKKIYSESVSHKRMVREGGREGGREEGRKGGRKGGRGGGRERAKEEN